jgi:IMP dehydrogenase
MFRDKLEVPLALTFDDVLLIPAPSLVEPNEADIHTRFSRNISLNMPLVGAAMDTVTESAMAMALAREGGIGVIHRNMSPEQEIEEVRRVKRAEELIERNVVSVSPETSVSDVERLMVEHGIGGVPVLEHEKIVGIVSRRDVRAIASRRGSESVKAIMTRQPITAGEDISMEQALETMYTNKVERLPVVDKAGHLIGIITMQDILEKRQYPNATRDARKKLRVAAAVGPFDIERAHRLDECGVDALVVDCAHGHNLNVVKAIRDIKGSTNADIVAGNIATAAAAEDLIDTVDGLKVGIGPGSICTTRIVAGVGVPQITAIASVADVTRDTGIPVIADGGIRFSGDVAKAIAAGADCVMIGSLFAGTDESPGRVITMKGRRYKQYRGMGSLGVMSGGVSSDRYFQKKEIGKTKFAMGYTGSKTIQEMHEKTRFVRITAAGHTESHPHNIMITDEAPNYRISD